MARLVLVADDSPTIQKKVQGILKGEGFEVETVSNGVAAIKRLAVVQPALVLADVSMPGKDGYEVCDFVKHSAQLSHVPVLLVASDMEPYDEARGARVRADGKFKKPFEPQDLISIVARYATRSETAESLGTLPGVATPPLPETVPEFEVANIEAEEPMRGEPPAAPNLPTSSEGVAFAEPWLEEAPHDEHAPDRAELEAPTARPLSEQPAAPAPEVPAEVADLFVTPEQEAASPAAEIPRAVDKPPSPAHEPVLIEERTVPIPIPPILPPPSSTLIFRAPVEIAEPVWRDEPVPPAPPPDSQEVLAPEPHAEVGTMPAPPEVSAPEPLEPIAAAPLSGTTSRESFSLDDAAAGQVHSIFGETAGVPSPAAVDVSGAEKAVESRAPEIPTGTQTETSAAPSVEILPEVPGEPPAEPAPPAESGLVAEIPRDISIPPPAEIHAEPSAPQPLIEPPLEISAETPEEPPAEILTEAAAEPASTSAETPAAPATTVPAANLPLPSSPPPAIDWDLLYLIVRKIVLKMSPPALSREDAEELARRLADETAFELSAELPSPEH